MANKIRFDVEANIAPVKQAANEIGEVFNKISLPANLQKSFNSTFQKLSQEIRNFEVQAERGFESLADSKKAQNSLDKILTYFSDLKLQARELSTVDLEKFFPKETVERLKKFNNLLKQTNTLQNKDNSKAVEAQTKEYEKATKKVKELEDKIKAANNAKEKFEESKSNASTQYDELARKIEEARKKQAELIDEGKKSGVARNVVQSSVEYKQLGDEIKKLQSAQTTLTNTQQSASKSIDKQNESLISLNEQLRLAKSNADEEAQALEKEKIAAGATAADIQKLRNEIAQLTNTKVDTLPQTLVELKAHLNDLIAKEGDTSQFVNIIGQINQKLEQGAQRGQQINQVFNETVRGPVQNMAAMNSEMDQLKNRFQYFFSAINGIQLFKRAIRDAFDSVKELDAAMTEMAVVTDYTIGDIWKQIDLYTSEANQLGATTTDVIKSMVLYTQQGLNMAQATQLSTETMKMARIAGLEGAEATDLMTAALRGFNMELNETSAQRVNDVYSNLAANAAANTHEIADAMTRTASIANAAGMEFETTAAFLTQMIETTRESAENLGTAMKTIIARFTEMKKAPADIINVEGEEISVNKVEAALKSVGVELRNTTGEFRDLDDVFLELASKWDSLDVMSQRYVATMAAGSRQQSRFIAMMSNYQRTMELTGYATNSAGASQKQFEKTMDSLESKLNRLHNAWEQFTTGITNASIIKGAVDLLTNLLTTINKITDALDPLNTGWAKTLTAILAFKAGSKLVNGVFKNIGTQIAACLGKEGSEAGKKYSKDFIESLKRNIKIQDIAKVTKHKQKADKYSGLAEKERERATASASRYAAAMEAETAAIERQKIAKKTLSTTEKELALAKKEVAVQQKAGLVSTEAQVKVENLEIRAKQQKIALTAANNEVETAHIATQEAEYAATTQNVMADKLEEKATKEKILAKEAEQANENIGLLTKAKYYAMMLFGTKTTRENARASLADAGSKFAQAGATGTATGAQAALNTAMMACPIGWILAGIAAIVAALAIFAYVHETGAEKVERMDKTMQKLNESARETTSAINELSDTWEKLQEQNENLDKLTKGTLEWKKQLVEINQTVLDLIEKFPSLAAHVNMIGGKLEISEVGLEELQERQLKAAETQQFASIATQLQQVIQKAKNENLYDEKNKDFRVDNYKDSQDRKEKEQKILTYDIDRQQKIQLLVSSALSGIKLSANVEDDEKLKSIISGALEIQDYDEKLEEIKAETSEDRKAYADLLCLTETQVNQMMKDGDLTSDQLRTSLAAEKLLEEIRSTANNISDSLISENSNKHIRNLVQNKLSSNDIEYFKEQYNKYGNNKNFVEFLKSELSNLGITPNNTELIAYVNRIENSAKEINKLGQKSFTTETSNLVNILNKALGDGEVDIASQKKLQEKFVQLSLSGIDEAGKQSFNKVIENILNSFEEDAEAKEAFINKFLDLDISSLSEIEGFFEELNVAGHEVSSQLQKEFKETTKAANDFSLENVQETLSSREVVNAVKEKIKSDKDSDKSFTEEQYNKVTAALHNNGLGDLVDNFVKDPTSSEKSPKYFYSGSLSELGNKLENSIDNATDSAIQKLEEQNKIVGNIERITKESPDLIKAIEDGSYFKTVDSKAFSEGGKATELITGIASSLIADIEDGTDGFFESETVKSFLEEILKYTYSGPGDYYVRLAEILNNNKNNLATSDIILLMKELIPTRALEGSLIKPVDLGLESFNEVDVSGAPIEYLMNAINNDSIDTGDYRVKLKKLLDENLITIEQYNEWLKLTPKEILPKLQQIINPSQNTNQIQADIDALYGSAYSGKTAIEALKIFPKTEQALKAQNSVIQQIVESHEGWEIRLKEIKKQYNLTGAAATENARKIAAAEYELNEQVDNIRSILSDNKEALENTGTDKYYESISKLVDAFKVIYGDKIDDAWVEENLGTIKQITVGKIEAEAAFKKLQATAKAELLEIPLKLEVEGDASNADLSFFSDKIKGFYDDWKKNSEALGEEIAGNSDKIKANIASIQEALTKIDNSDASIQVKADTRAALGELIKVALLQAYIKDDIKAYKQWLELANKNNFSVGGLEITRYKKMEVTFNNGKLETKELGSFGEEYLKKVGDVAIIDQSGSVQVTPNSEGTGNPDYDKDKKTSSDDWENDYDKYYNTLKRIESIERERNRLAKEQEKLTKRRFIDEQALMKNKQEQIKLLKQQAAINAELARDAESYLRGSGNGDVWYDTNTGTIQTNPNAAYYNEEQMKIFNKQLKMMEGHYDQMKNAKDNLADIYEQIEDLTEVVSELTDPTYNFDRIVEVLDNTLKNLEREITRLERTDSGATIQQVRRRYEQSAQTYVDKYNQNTNKKAIQEQQLNSLIHSDYSKYFTVDWATKQLTRTATYAGITDPEMQKSVDTIISQAQELCNGIIELDNDQKDIEDSLYDLKKNLADKALEFQEKVYEAVVHAREQAIENLKNIDTSINNAASELTSSIQKNIQKIRQDRQNQKTEEELQNMEARLSFLQTDTSNANQKNILDLQKQLSDKQESYTDSLIDQKISELQAQNDEAAKQRKRQIEVMEAQLEIDKENGVIWRAVDNAIKTGINMSGHIQKGTELYNILSSLDEVTKMNATQIANWMGDLNNLAAMFGANATANLDVESQMSDKVKNADSVFGENSAYIKSLKDRLEAMNNDGNFNHLMWYDQEGQKMVYKYSHYWASSDEEAKAYNNKVAQYRQLAQELANARAYYKINKDRYMTAAFDRTYHYASGGLADYTGPAWLDGSKTSPELVLNPQDTENFLILKDVLANLINRGSSNDNSNGDNYFEIHIDVDKISGDYDVDQMVERVQQKIAEQSRYRNVNIINMMR